MREGMNMVLVDGSVKSIDEDRKALSIVTLDGPAEFLYAFYRIMVYDDGEIGILIPLWSLPYYFWQKKVKKILKEEELTKNVPEYKDPLEEEILKASAEAGIIQQKPQEMPNVITTYNV